MLFDHRADPSESENLAYFGAHMSYTHSLRAVVLRDWHVTLSESPPPNATRAQRAEYLREITGFKRNWWKR